MSIKTIKNTLENYLNTNITTTAIKWTNTTAYSLNSTALTQTQISALTNFIEPKVIPIISDRDTIAVSNGIKHLAFFQIDIYAKKNTGTGKLYDIANDLDLLFREKVIGDVTCDNVTVLPQIELDESVSMSVRVRCFDRD